MKMPWSNFEGPAKFILVCVTILLVALGMCGLQFAVISIASGFKNGILVAPLMVLGFVELAAMSLAFLGIVLGLLWMLVRAIISPGKSKTTERSEPPVRPENRGNGNNRTGDPPAG